MGIKELVAAGLILLAVTVLREWLAAMWAEKLADREEAFALHMAERYSSPPDPVPGPSEAVVRLLGEPLGNGKPPPAESLSVSD